MAVLIKGRAIVIRKIIKIDEEKCTGCGVCALACHEGAIEMVAGKAKLTREDYCDGLGDCLPACPANAISFEEREALAYNEEAVIASKGKEAGRQCPGSKTAVFQSSRTHSHDMAISESYLSAWPVHIKLVPTNAPFFENAHILIAADCTAFAYGNFHNDFMKDKVTLVGCPKLDEGDYSEKLTSIFTENDIKSVTVARMEVPCCGGIEVATKKALEKSGKSIPMQVATISIEGKILS